jgi:hypothetical protein
MNRSLWALSCRISQLDPLKASVRAKSNDIKSLVVGQFDRAYMPRAFLTRSLIRISSVEYESPVSLLRWCLDKWLSEEEAQILKEHSTFKATGVLINPGEIVLCGKES